MLLIPKKNIQSYKKIAKEAEEVWKSFGALNYKECMGEDLAPKALQGMPAPLSFTSLTKAHASDTVWFSFITYKNKTHRNQVNKKLIQYFNKKYANTNEPMPFDMSKMAVGGFSVNVG